MRKAMCLLIDRQYIVDTIAQAEQEVANTFIPTGMSDGNGGEFRKNDDDYTYPLEDKVGYYDTDMTDANMEEVQALLESCLLYTSTLENAVTGRAAVPSGASTGQFEAVELRDGETRYFGLGVQKAVKNVNTKLKAALLGKNALCQLEIDRILMDADGTDNKSNLGANAKMCIRDRLLPAWRNWRFPSLLSGCTGTYRI